MVRMKNELFDEFKRRVAISNFEEEYEKRRKQEMKKLKIANVAAVLAVAVVIGCVTPTIYAKIKWNIEFNEYKEKTFETPTETLDYARESGFADKIDEDYVVKDGVGIKLDSFLLTDDCLNARVSFKFSEEKEVDSGTFEFGYVIYDENKNIYGLQTRRHENRTQEENLMIATFKKLGVKYDENAIFDKILNDRSSIENIVTTENRTIVRDITLRAKDIFPKSQKIYIEFFDLGYLMMDWDAIHGEYDPSQVDMEDFPITEEEWIFERDTSEKFSERDTLNLVLKDEIPDFQIEKCTLTESGMILDFKSEEYMKLVGTVKEVDGILMNPTWNMVTITDGEGKQYGNTGSGGTESGSYRMDIDAGKKDLEKKLFVNFISNGQKYTSELVEN